MNQVKNTINLCSNDVAAATVNVTDSTTEDAVYNATHIVVVNEIIFTNIVRTRLTLLVEK